MIVERNSRGIYTQYISNYKRRTAQNQRKNEANKTLLFFLISWAKFPKDLNSFISVFGSCFPHNSCLSCKIAAVILTGFY